jgi:L-ascorbate metabolism protein UlaG (beta-lactamase superfamily)
MVLYRIGEYKKALPYAKEAALIIAEGQNAERIIPMHFWQKKFFLQNNPEKNWKLL